MVSNWEKIKLIDFIDIKTGFPFKSKKYLEHGEGYKLLRGDNIVQGSFRWANVKLWSEDELTEKQKSYFLEDGDVILAMDRPWIEAGLKTAQITKKDLPCLLVQRVARLQAKNRQDQDFLRYLISSYWFVEYVKLVQTGTAVPHISTKQILDYETIVPPLQERKKIGGLLRYLDDKIELNRQMNETLEAMAQALFKSWFVDFDPVIDNALLAGKAIPEPFKKRAEIRQVQLDSGKANTNSQINDLFPSEFEFTEELGWIPKGWSIANFGDLLNSTIGGDWGKPEPDEKHTIPSVIIRGTDIPDLKTGNRSAAPKRWVEAKKLKTRKLEPYDIVIEISGGSPTQSTGRSIIIDENLLERLGGTVEPASFCRRFTPIDKYIGVYAGIHLQKIYDDGKMWEYQNQSTGIANFQTTSFLEREILVLPNKELIVKYYESVNPLINKMTSNQQIELAKLRDTLLPKLMSGELRIADAEKLAENI